jgi:hypothetical protein
MGSGSGRCGLSFGDAPRNDPDFVFGFDCCGSLFEPMDLSDTDWRALHSSNGGDFSSSVRRIHALDQFSLSEPQEKINAAAIAR